MAFALSGVANFLLPGDLSFVLPGMSQFFHDPVTEHGHIFGGKVVSNGAVKQHIRVGSKLIITTP